MEQIIGILSKEPEAPTYEREKKKNLVIERKKNACGCYDSV